MLGTAQAEYQRFLAYLAGRPVSDDVRRMANLVHAHFNQLAVVGTQRRGRSIRLSDLAVEHLAQTPSEIHVEPTEADGNSGLQRLHRLEIGPFRGFTRQEIFDLNHQTIFIYGPNGTGKSSFCEALEVALLGFISEAQAKRIDHRTYCNNVWIGRHEPPTLFGTIAGAVTRLTPNEEEYRFCFIEKNRLDDFARIAARTPGDQRQLIATLFGVDQFNDFVRGFNPSLDENLSLVGPKSLQLAGLRAQLAASLQTLQAYDQRVQELQHHEVELAGRINPERTFQECCEWILGTEGQHGRLAALQATLEAAPLPIYGVTQQHLEQLLTEVYRLHALLTPVNEQLALRTTEVSFSQLYSAVLALSEGAASCPACGTSLDRVNENPFEKARQGLNQLAELALLQEQQSALVNQLNQAFRSLLDEMKKCVSSGNFVCQQFLLSSNLPQLPEGIDGNWLALWVNDERRLWNLLMQVAVQIEQHDVNTRTSHQERQAIAEERARLDGFRLEIERLKTLRGNVEQERALALQTIAQFEASNERLIAEVAEEDIKVAFNQRIKVAYDEFLPELQRYLNGLPSQLIQGLNDRARDLYNAFNRDDPPSDLLHALRLPLAENGRIEVEFLGAPGVSHDALIILSEGHIRCLGLAILLAKNLAQECPIVIFDDVVNAIDDEHRNGIWRTFFEDGLLNDKQIILTSHAEEFLLRIEQELGAERARLIKKFKFLPHLGERELRIDTDPPTKNYVLQAQESLQREDKREALRNARSAIESLTDQVWTWLGRRVDARIELKLPGPRANWELNDKCSKLRSTMRRMQNPPPGVPEVIGAFDSLLGVNGGAIEWGYLNGGTHDSQRDHEFDRAAVRTIVDAVVALDAGLVRLRAG